MPLEKGVKKAVPADTAFENALGYVMLVPRRRRETVGGNVVQAGLFVLGVDLDDPAAQRVRP